MLYLKLFENFDEELPYVKISTQDFLDEYNQVNNIIPIEGYDFHLLDRIVGKMPNGILKVGNEHRRSTKHLDWVVPYISIRFSEYASITVYKTETKYFIQVFEPKDNKEWEVNFYKMDDILDVIDSIKNKYKVYKSYYQTNESIFNLENEIIKKIPSDKYTELKKQRIYNDDGMLGDKLIESLHKYLYKIFNHDKFKYEHSLKHITIYENKNTTISFYISLLEDDYFLVEFKPSAESYFFICDGFLGLKKLIKGEYEQFQKRIPRLYYDISQIAFDFPKKNLSIDSAEISIDNNSIGELKKLKNSLKVINDIDVNKAGLYNYQITLKGRTYFETCYSSEYDWWVVRYIKPNLSSLYYHCITVDGLIELIQDKIKKDGL